MLGIIWQFLYDNFPQLAGYFLILVLIVYVVWEICSFYKDTKNVNTDQKGIKDTLNLMQKEFHFFQKELHIFQKEFHFFQKELHIFQKELHFLGTKFDSLVSALSENGTIKGNYFGKNSPVTLTEKGIELIKSLGWDKIVENQENKKFLFNKLDQLNLKYKADVEKHCILIIHMLNGETKENSFTQVKIYLYENANVDKQSAIYACALYIRDKYLQEHPEIR